MKDYPFGGKDFVSSFEVSKTITPERRGDLYSDGDGINSLLEHSAASDAPLRHMPDRKLGEKPPLQELLTPTELQILNSVLAEVKKDGTLELPEEHGDKSWEELYEARAINNDMGRNESALPYTEYRWLSDIPELIARFRPNGRELFFIPEDYQDTTLEDFEVRCEGHETALLLLQQFGPQPPKGLYLWGSYGNGKTHLATAFAKSLKAEIVLGGYAQIDNFARDTIAAFSTRTREARKLRVGAVKRFNKGEEARDQESLERFGVPYMELDISDSEQEAFREEMFRKSKRPLDRLHDKSQEYQEMIDNSGLDGVAMQIMSHGLQEYPFEPSDVAFATFDFLVDHADDEGFIEEFLKKPVLIIDDVHPKDDRRRLDLMQKIVEHRYNEVRRGATFITSNLSPSNVLTGPNYPKEIAERCASRLAEMCMGIEFTSGDFRLERASTDDEALLASIEGLRKTIQRQDKED